MIPALLSWILVVVQRAWVFSFDTVKVYYIAATNPREDDFGYGVLLQVILFEIDCAIFYTNLHELFRQFISWTNWVNSGKFMDNCWISCQVMDGMKKVYDDLIIVNLYELTKQFM